MRKAKTATLQERLRDVYGRWFMREPMMLMALSSHDLTVNNAVSSIRSGQGRIEYNESWMSSLDDDHLEAALKAEAIRILLRHPYRYPPGNAAVSYMASNITLNEYYEGLEIPFRASEYWSDASHRSQYFEFYYSELLKLFVKAPARTGQAPESPRSDDGGGSDAPLQSAGTPDGQAGGEDGEAETAPRRFEAESLPEEADGPAAHSRGAGSGPDEPEEEGAGGVPGFAARLAHNAALWQDDPFMDSQLSLLVENCRPEDWGSIKGMISEQIAATLQPVTDYRAILSGFRATLLSSERVMTRMKPSRRYGFMSMGRRFQFRTLLLVGVDVSGSVSSQDLQTFYSVINRFFRYGVKRVDVVPFDTVLQGEPVVLEKARASVTVTGRGGTSFSPIIKYFGENRRIYDGLIVFTDGFAEIPEVPARSARRIVWVCNNKANFDKHKKWMRERGRCCHIRQ